MTRFKSSLLAILSFLLCISGAKATEDWERDCGVVLGDILLSQTQPIPELHTFNAINADGKFAIPKGFEHAKGVYCTRSTSVPFDSDYEVVISGYPLYIYSDNYRWTGAEQYKDAEDALTILELVEGKFSFRVIEGHVHYTWHSYTQEQIEKFNFALEKSASCDCTNAAHD